MALQAEHSKAINWLDRSQIVAILEGHSFQCYDHESNDELREALKSNIDDGTINPSVLDS